MPNRRRDGKRLFALALVLAGVIGAWRAAASVAQAPGRDVPGSMEHGGQMRTWILHIPPSYDGTRPLPLVVVLHGAGGAAVSAADRHGWSAVADREGFLVAYPNGGAPLGPGYRWNIFNWTDPPDDTGFLRALIAYLAGEYRLDPERVFMAGHSNGASMTNTFLYRHSDVVAAAAPALGLFITATGVDPFSIHQPPAPVPVWIWRGAEETQQVPGATEPRDVSDRRQKEYWRTFNDCDPIPAVRQDSDRRFRYTTEAFVGCAADVWFTEVAGQSHAYRPEYTEKIWREFFARHTRPEATAVTPVPTAATPTPTTESATPVPPVTPTPGVATAITVLPTESPVPRSPAPTTAPAAIRLYLPVVRGP